MSRKPRYKFTSTGVMRHWYRKEKEAQVASEADEPKVLDGNSSEGTLESVKRFQHVFGPEYDGSAQYAADVVLASDHDRIVAELRAEVERTKGFEAALEDAVIKYRETIAIQARVIEKLKAAKP